MTHVKEIREMDNAAILKEIENLKRNVRPQVQTRDRAT